MNFQLTVFLVLLLFVLFGLFPVKSIYVNSSDKDTGLSSEEISSIRNFSEQAKESIEEANTLIRNKELNKAKIELENILNLVREKISTYKDMNV